MVDAQFSDLLAPSAAARERAGIALCLSGGGYRAMLFHAGALRRLNELRLLSGLDFVSSVSGGSIAAGVLAHRWDRLTFRDDVATNFDTQIVDPLLDLAGRTLDVGSVVKGVLLPWQRVSDQLISGYEKYLFGDATLQELPDRPRFIFTATNLQSGALMRMSKRYLRDWLVGEIRRPTLPLAVAVAASSAFPPILSPVALKLPAGAWSSAQATLGQPAFRDNLVLSDGGVYDNLGLEPVIKRCATIMVSDGGGKLEPAAKVASDWARHTRRVLSVIDQQVRNLRSRMLIHGYEQGEYGGTYWGIRTPISRYDVPEPLRCPEQSTVILAETPTRLAAMPTQHRRRLVNWGYAGCDAAVRQWLVPTAGPPGGFPYPDDAVG